MNENELPVYKEKLGKKEWWIEVRKQVKSHSKFPENVPNERNQPSTGHGPLSKSVNSMDGQVRIRLLGLLDGLGGWSKIFFCSIKENFSPNFLYIQLPSPNFGPERQPGQNELGNKNYSHKRNYTVFGAR